MQAFSIAAAGMTNAIARFDASARRTVQIGAPGGENVDLAQEAVAQINAKLALKASAQVARTADELTGVLLDISA